MVIGASFEPAMPLFSRTVDPDTPFKKNEVVSATVDLPGVPAGTQGRVKVINGFDWQRYWVFFDNGVELGQLDNDDLVRPQHWDHWHEAKAAAEEAAAKAAEAAAAAAAGGGDAAGAASEAAAGDDPLAALRAMVPAHLLERSAAAKARILGG